MNLAKILILLVKILVELGFSKIVEALARRIADGRPPIDAPARTSTSEPAEDRR